MASSIIPKALNGDISSLNDALSNTNSDLTALLGNRDYGIRTRTVGTLQITNSLGEEDFSDVFSSIYYAIATVSNTSSSQIIVSTTYSGTIVRVRCVPRSNLTDNANTSTPTVRFLVIGTLK